MKICSKCKMEKEKDEFNKNKYTKDGLYACCRLCYKKYYGKNKKEYDKQYFKKHHDEKLKYFKKYNSKYSKTFQSRFSKWKHGAKIRNIEFSITLKYLQSLPCDTCFYTNKKLTFEHNYSNTISLDRIDSTKGYIEGNVVFCCWKINTMKNIGTIKELIDYCENIIKTDNKREIK